MRLKAALNSEAGPGQLGVAANAELPADGSAPDWVELIPAGEPVGEGLRRINGYDGRWWVMGDPQAVITASSREVDLPVDWEHASEHKAPHGGEAPAAGWIREFEVRDGAIWARIEWTERARGQIERREYRYLSPVFFFTPAEHRIVRLTSAGLTNQPNFAQTALNREHPETPEEEPTVKWTELLKRLGLPEDADESKAIQAVDQLQGDLQTAKNRAEANPSLDKYVPRSDYDAVVERATNAEGQLAEQKKQQQEAAIEAAVNQALEDGKITPATVGYHKAQCRTEGGLERFKEFSEAAPKVATDTDLDGRKPEEPGKALNAETQEVAAALGHSEEDLRKYGGLRDGAQ